MPSSIYNIGHYYEDYNLRLYYDRYRGINYWGKVESSLQRLYNDTGLRPDVWTQVYYRDIKSTMHTDQSYIVSSGNINISANTLLNRSSVISSTGDTTIKAATLNNITSSNDVIISDYKINKRLGRANTSTNYSGEALFEEFSSLDVDTQYVAGTATIYSADQALIQSGGTLTVNGGTSGIVNNSGIFQSINDIYIINGAQGQLINDGTFQTPGNIHITTGTVENKKAYNPKGIQNPENPNITVYNTSTLKNIADTGTINLTDYINIGAGGNALFTVNYNGGVVNEITKPGYTPASITGFTSAKPIGGISFTGGKIDLISEKALDKDPKPDFKYLIETRSDFIDVSKLKGTEYLLDRIGFHPDEDIAFLGDAFYEQKLVSEAILKTTNQRFLDENIKSDQEQMAWLLDNAASAYRDLHLAVGVQLTKEQINNLQQPIIWYVEEEVMGVKVLAPKLYIPEHIVAGFTRNTGSVIAGNTVKIEASGDVTNSGVIKGKTSVDITAETIKNETIGETATISGGNVSLKAQNDIINTGATIKGDNSVSLTAVNGDIVNETRVFTKEDPNGNIKSTLGTTASIESGGTLKINAGGDFTNIAADVTATGDADIAAGGDVNFETVTLYDKTIINSGGWHGYSESSTAEGSTLSVGGNLVLTSGRDINFIGSSADIAGNADVDVEGNFNLINDYNTTYSEKEKTSSGMFSSKTTTEISSTKTVVGSSFNTGGSLNVDSGNNINIVGSDMTSGGDADINAEGDQNIVAVHDESYYSRTSEKSGFGTGGSLYGSEKTTDTVSDKTVNGSTVDIKGQYASNSGGDTNITGSTINVGGAASITTGGDLNITAAYNEHAEEHKTETSGYGTTGGDLYSGVIDVVGNGSSTASASVINAGNLTVNSGNDVYIEGSSINAGNATFVTAGNFTETSARETSYEYSFHEETTLSLDFDTSFDDGRLSATLASGQYDSVEERTENITQSASEINVNGNLAIDSGNDITIAGSNINVGGDVSLSAVNNVNIETTENSTNTETKETHGTVEFSVGASNTVNGVKLAAEALQAAKDTFDAANDSYDKYKENMNKAEDDLAKGLIEQYEYDSMEKEKEFYLANIALAAENIVAKTAALLQATTAAAASAGTYGFSADAQLEIDATVTTTTSGSTTSVGSNINSGGSFTVKAGNTAKIEGSNVSAAQDIILEAKNVEILAAENTNTSSSETAHANLTLTYSTSGGPSGSASADSTVTNSDGTTYTNSHLSGANITIRSTEDTTVSGGVVTAENKLTLAVGGDLTVESRQDQSSNSSHTIGISGGYGGSGANAGANGNMSNGERRWVTEQTSLTGGIVDIYVEDTTNLRGAVISSTTDDLTIDTGSLVFSNIKDKDTSSNIGGGVSAGGLGSDNVTGSVNATYGYTDLRQTNFATIGEGTITVRDAEDSSIALDGLNRDESISQYTTTDMGLQGGFTVDTATVDLVIDTAALAGQIVDDPLLAGATIIYDGINTAAQMYSDAADRTVMLIDEAIALEQQAEVIIEKSGNLIEHGVFGANDDPDVQRAVIREKFDEAVNDGTLIKDSLNYYQAKEVIYGLSESEFEYKLQLENDAEQGIIPAGFTREKAMILLPEGGGGGGGGFSISSGSGSISNSGLGALFGLGVAAEIINNAHDERELNRLPSVTAENGSNTPTSLEYPDADNSVVNHVYENPVSDNNTPSVLVTPNTQGSIWDYIFGSEKSQDGSRLEKIYGSDKLIKYDDVPYGTIAIENPKTGEFEWHLEKSSLKIQMFDHPGFTWDKKEEK